MEMVAAGDVLEAYPNKEDGITVLIVRGHRVKGGKFHVVMRDDDSGEYIGFVRICETIERAREIAIKWQNA
jgi:hypothetical protein